MIALTDPIDIFHTRSVTFINGLTGQNIEFKVSNPIMVEIGRIINVKGIQRYLEIMDSFEEFKIDFESTDMDEVWKLSQAYLDERVLTSRHRLDLFHYAAASLLNCSHLASWNDGQFNDKVAEKINRINSWRGLPSLIASRPDNIIRQEDLG